MNNPQDTDKPSLVLVMDQNNTMRVVRDTDSILTNIVKDYTKPQTQKISKSILSLIKQYKLNYLLNESKK